MDCRLQRGEFAKDESCYTEARSNYCKVPAVELDSKHLSGCATCSSLVSGFEGLHSYTTPPLGSLRIANDLRNREEKSVEGWDIQGSELLLGTNSESVALGFTVYPASWDKPGARNLKVCLCMVLEAV